MESRRLRASRARALRLALPLLLAACVTPEREDPSLDQAVTPPERGPLVVDRTLRVAPGEYLRPPLGPAGEAGVIRIERRRGLVLDLTGVTLRGQPAGSSPDTARGYAVLLRGCRDVTLRGGTFSGYLGGIVLDDCRDVVIEGASIEEGYADRLRSSVVTADPADLLVPETRRPTGWLDRYGAAIAIVGCRGVTVRASRARSGQNGVLLLGSEDCTVTGNDFSFLSGWGVGLLDSRDNTVSGNRLDFCARGYYGDAYAEGFNAAGMLVAEGCSGNTLAWNSATRCGFGLLVVGDARADEDERVAGNLYYGNDLSYAVAHGALLIGDRDDWLVDGRIVGSLDAAVRLVDADGVVVRGNALEDVPSAALLFESSRACLAIENRVRRCDRGIEIRPAPPLAGLDAASFGHWVVANTFDESLQDVVLEGTEGLVFADNAWSGSRPERHLDELAGEGAPELESKEVWAWLAAADGALPSGRAWDSSLRLIAAERHPWRRDLLRFTPPEGPGAPPPPRPDVPPGLSGLVVGDHGPWDFRGGHPRPATRLPGGLLAGASWDAAWFRWDGGSDPRGDLETWRALAAQPLLRGVVRHWLDPWGGGDARGEVGDVGFGLIAKATVLVPESDTYRLSVVSDDGLRLLVDDVVVFEDWTWHAARLEARELALSAGRHEFRLEYFQVDGAAALSIDLDHLPVAEHATSPGAETAALRAELADG